MSEMPEPAATMYRLTEKLREDLAFAAPELWPLHIERRLAQAYEAGAEQAESAVERLRTLVAEVAWLAPEEDMRRFRRAQTALRAALTDTGETP